MAGRSQSTDPSRPRSVLIDGMNVMGGGGTTYTAWLVNAMAQAAPDWRFHVVADHTVMGGILDSRPNILIHVPPWRPKGSAARFAYRQLVLPRLARRWRIEAVLAQFPGVLACPVPQIMMALNMHSLMEPPVANGFRQASYRRFQRIMFSISTRIATKTTYCSQFMASLARRWVSPRPGRDVTVYGGIDPEIEKQGLLSRPAPQKAGSDDRPYFLCIGTICGHKNYETTVRAFAMFRQAGGQHRLKVVGIFRELVRWRNGAGPKPALVALGEELGVGEQIDWLGEIDRDDLYPLLQGAIAYLSTSMLEAFNLTVLEAMEAGLPVLVPNTTCFPELVGPAGLLHDPTDPRAVCENMRKIAADPQLRVSLSEAARQRAQRYTWAVAAQAYLALLEDCAAGRAVG